MSTVLSCCATEVNPAWLDPVTYRAFLNRIFPGQWSRCAYEWYVTREFNGTPPDLLIRSQKGLVLSGMSVCYRQLRVAGSPPINISVLSAGGTLPGERGMGHYAALLRVAVERSRQRGCTAALGFVTADNASRRGLTRMGAHAIPSFYLFSPSARDRKVPATTTPAAGIPELGGQAHATFAVRRARARHGSSGAERSQEPVARFYYDRPAEWARQFLNRPYPVRAVPLPRGAAALIESTPSTDRLQWLACRPDRYCAQALALAKSSIEAGRKFFMYTLDGRLADQARQARLGVRPGYLMLQPTGYDGDAYSQLLRARWDVQAGDRL